MGAIRITDAREGERLYRRGVEIIIRASFAAVGPNREPDRCADYEVIGGGGDVFRVYASEEPAATWTREPPAALSAPAVENSDPAAALRDDWQRSVRRAATFRRR